MGAILQVVALAGTVLGFLFLTLCIASGLYYISEVVEEHTAATRKFLTRAVWGIEILLLLLMAVDRFPVKLSLFSMASHMLYYRNLRRFPYINLVGPTFIASCLSVVANHYLWFKYFNHVEIPPQFRFDPNYIPQKRATFAQVASFFAICVWFMPFALFVSLSAGDYVLPTSEEGKNPEKEGKMRRRTIGLARLAIGRVRAYVYAVLRVFGIQVQRDVDPLGI